MPRAQPFHFEIDRGVGVRASATTLLSYELTVFAQDSQDAVRHAGGWMCDRVRAGWKVTVVLPRDADNRALDILGVRTCTAAAGFEDLVGAPALAVSAHLFATDMRLRRSVLRALERGSAEVTLWGDADGHRQAGPVTDVRYPLSPAARAFKTQALLAACGGSGSVAGTEHFHSCAPWYPLDGPDLISAG